MAAEAGGEEARALVERLVPPLDSAVRLMLLDVLTVAAAEITRELAPGSVELRLRGVDPEFVVVAPSPGDGGGEAWGAGGSLPAAAGGGGDGSVSRVNLRLPEQLKSRVDQAADREGLSINTWLVRAVAAAVEHGETGVGREHSTPRSRQGYTGWGR